MPTLIQHKRDLTAGRAPGVGDLEYGEIAINPRDGKLFFKKVDGTGNTAMVHIKEDTETNFFIDSSTLNNSNSASLSGVLHDFDAAFVTNLYDLNDVNVDNNLLSIGDSLAWNGNNWVAVGNDSSGGGGVGLSPLTVQSVDANGAITTVANVDDIQFDSDSGFDVVDLGNGSVKIAMNSTFKTWKVDGQDDLVATGLDTIELIAGPGMEITTQPNASLYQTITFSSTGSSENLLGVIIDFDIDADGDLILTHVDTFNQDNVEIDNGGYFILSDA